MSDGQSNNAMTEIALALAMAFFSIMVLTMVSMGVGFQAAANRALASDDAITIAASEPAPDDSGPAGEPNETIVIHYAGRFLDTDLRPIDITELPAGGSVVLALEPTLPMAGALAVRGQIAAANITVTTLDSRWLNALKELPQ